MAEPTTGTTPDAETGSGPVVRDRRRLDPETGKVRGRHANDADDNGASAPGAAGEESPAAPGPEAEAASVPETTQSDELAAAQALADERLADLQRLQAEYVNYRRRVDRDRDVARDAAVAGVLEA